MSLPLHSNIKQFRKKKVAILTLAIISIFITKRGCAEEYSFNPNALEIDNPSGTAVDLSQFSTTGAQAPGVYRTDIFLNGEKQDTLDITFISNEKGSLVPQLTFAQLDSWGVKVSAIPEMAAQPRETVVTDIAHFIPQAAYNFDFSRQALNISIPQASMRASAQGYVDPKYWDEGLPALLMDYNFSGSSATQNGEGAAGDSYFLNLHNGLNLGAWRLRNYSTWNYQKNSDNGDGSSTHSKWDSINTFLQRDIKDLKAQLIIGDSFTPSEVFESVQFRGAQLSSDDNMLPDSLRGFAPTIRGIANTNARISIKQNGSLIYQSNVSPGAFTISDLYPTSSSGDLLVTITEADGTERSFVQPFSNVPVMQREGHLKYSMTIGKYRSQDSHSDEPVLGQSTVMYGLPHDLTTYGGIQASDNYKAAALGMGLGLGEYGSVSLDATQSYANIQPDLNTDTVNKSGQSYRFQYSKDFAATDSTVTLAGYRYSTKGFYTFQEATDYQQNADGSELNFQNNKRSRLQLELTQSLNNGEWGSLSLSGYQQNYWNRQGNERNLSASYSNSVWEGVNWTLMYTYSELTDSSEPKNQQLALSISVPLSRWLSSAYVSSSTVTDMHGKVHNQAGLSGTALEDNNLSYSLAQGYGNKGEEASSNLHVDYKGAYGEVNGGYSHSAGSNQINYGASGSLIAHEHGVTFGQSLGGDNSAVALVEAPGAAGVKVQNGSGVRTDWRGYTIVPYISSYKRSRIGLDPTTLGDNVELKENVVSVVPTSGAVVPAVFKTSIGTRALITVLKNGEKVPFGALVTLKSDSDNITGIMGDDGQVYMSGMPDKGELLATWGEGKTQQCHAPFDMSISRKSNDSPATNIQFINVNCN
ncbi:fimbrial biogenesis outer membrane usher protein [Enterobacter asburiae]|nr:fimbrial biogenesis outer membrane usher protein [Enterobacter asburiae]